MKQQARMSNIARQSAHMMPNLKLTNYAGCLPGPCVCIHPEQEPGGRGGGQCDVDSHGCYISFRKTSDSFPVATYSVSQAVASTRKGRFSLEARTSLPVESFTEGQSAPSCSAIPRLCVTCECPETLLLLPLQRQVLAPRTAAASLDLD
jgi:hypothetical protein